MAARQRIPAIYEGRAFTAAGGLISYGTSFAEAYRQIGLYTGKNPSRETNRLISLSWSSTKFRLVINLKTAKALNLTMPPTLIAEADEVIE